MVKINPDNIKAIECKNVKYQAAVDGSYNDILLIKEVVHTKDGQHIGRIRTLENFEREFYITRPDKRNHEQKKEYELKENLIEYKTTQVEMSNKIQMALGRRFPDTKQTLGKVCSNPYVYYADITTPTILKAKYLERWPIDATPNKVAILDIETDVLNNNGDVPVLITVTCGNEKIVGIVNSYMNRIPDCFKTVTGIYEKLLSNVTIKDSDGNPKVHNLVEECGGCNITFLNDPSPAGLFSQIMKRVHEMMPDFVAIWNMNFDLPKIIKCLEKENYNIADVFCDPSVPEKYRHAKYIEAQAIKVTNSKKISKHPADLWHVMDCVSGHYWIDAMALFKNIRTANGNEPSYSLDAVLKKYLGIGKLKFDGVEGEGTLRWHINMQRDYPAEYIVYNVFDCISVELLDEVTKDLHSTVSALADISEMSIFQSLPKRLVDILTYFYKERGLIIGTCGRDVVSETDEKVIDISGFIVTLHAYMVVEDGLHCIEECPELRTKFRRQTADDDLAQAYPTGELVMNISKETTVIEILSIDGVSEKARRRAGINLTGGRTNAIEVCNDIMGLPYIHDVLDLLMQDIKEGKINEPT